MKLYVAEEEGVIEKWRARRRKKGEPFLTFEAGMLLKTNNNNNFGIGSFHHIYENKRLILP